jgi:hypothetical protein
MEVPFSRTGDFSFLEQVDPWADHFPEDRIGDPAEQTHHSSKHMEAAESHS